jgi:hypothetical protein
VIALSAGGSREAADADVPAVDQAVDDGQFVPIVGKMSGQSNRVDGVTTKR